MKRKLFLLWLLAFCSAAVNADSSTPQGADAGPPGSGTSAAVTVNQNVDAARAGETPSPSDEEYRIGTNDLLEVSVFQAKELDRAVRVNSHGLITLSLIGPIQAAGLSATELEARIAEKLKAAYLQDPQVSVFIKEFTSQRVTIEGQVEKTGIYPMTGPTTLLQAIALAGGVKDVGDTALVRVFRLEKGGARQMIVYDLDQVRSGGISDPRVKNNDIVVVDKSQTKATIKMITDTLRGFITFGAL